MSTDETGGKPSAALRTEALEQLLTERGLVASATVDSLIAAYETQIGPLNGAKVVAKAWTDPDFRERLLTDSASVLGELGYLGRQGEDIVVVANSETVHNVVVCTLCSCYPWSVLGLPPSWYKDPSYRARMVREPRKVLSEMGLELGDDVKIVVHDSTTEMRWLVLPERPAGTEHLTEEELIPLITRDSMVGVAKVSAA
jgi:nitrile hydratase subunit alpha